MATPLLQITLWSRFDLISRQIGTERLRPLGQTIYCAQARALMTAALLIMAFSAALVGVRHSLAVATMFVAALGQLMVSLINLAREIPVQLVTIGLD